MMKTFWDLLRNFGNIFSLLGFLFTIYFGVFYVPSWLREAQNEKAKNSQNEILQSVKELVFSDSSFTVSELTSLIHAKEITLEEKFPLSLSDVLTKVQESFMEDRYLPLTKRQELIREIENFKKDIPKDISPTNAVNVQNLKSKGFLWTQWLSIVGSLIAVLIGLISTFLKYQSDKYKEEEIRNEMQEVTPPHELRKFGYEFEREIENVLAKRPYINIKTGNKDAGIDFEFEHEGKSYFIEAKYLSRSKIGLSTLHQLKNYLRDKTGEAWLIYNTDLTPLVTKEIETFNNENPSVQLKAIRVTNATEFADKLDYLLRERTTDIKSNKG